MYINLCNPTKKQMSQKIPHWDEAKDCHLSQYHNLTDKALKEISLPTDLSSVEAVSELYSNITQALHKAAEHSIPKCKAGNFKQIPGWNDVVKESHEQARDAFLLWHSNGKPRFGPLFELMRTTRARFKYALRQCKKEEKCHRANSLARHLGDKDYKQFWRGASTSMNKKTTVLPSVVGGVSGETEIANLWKQHYSELFNSVRSTEGMDSVLHDVNEGLVNEDDPSVSVEQISNIIAKLPCSKAMGPDGLKSEHYKFASRRLAVLLTICISAMLKIGFLPQSLMMTTLTPIIKNKMGDVSDIGNYRPIAISTVSSKIIERLLLSHIEDTLYTTHNQFGFKKKLSTDMAIFTLKQVISYYSEHSSPIFICFLDASKAFDRINHCILFRKLLKRKVPLFAIRILMYWYREQHLNVKWGSVISQAFTVSNGVKQGGILSPLLFNCYMNDLSCQLTDSLCGCHIEGVAFNHIVYADDMCLIAPSPSGLQRLLNICSQYASSHDILYNAKKSVSMLIQSKKVKFSRLPPLYLNGNCMNYVDSYKYLGVMISNSMADNLDFERQRRALYASANRLKRSFGYCSYDVKKQLFSSFCANLYCSHLWGTSTITAFKRVRVAYNNAYRILFNHDKYCSASLMFVSNDVFSFEALIRKNIFNFMCRLNDCENILVKIVSNPTFLYSFNIGKRWREVLY